VLFWAAMAFGVGSFVLAFIECETRGRIFLAVLAASVTVWFYAFPGAVSRWLALVACIVIFIGCFFYVRLAEIRRAWYRRTPHHLDDEDPT